MKTVRSYYEILGVPRGAPIAQIKRKYRLLVRRYHPDVAQDKVTAHRLFIQITEAYEVLSDPARRRAYDEGLDLQMKRNAAATTSAASTARASASPRDFTAPSGPAKVAQLVKDAQWAFIQRKYVTAASLLKEALTMDSTNSIAFAMLGDVYRSQGKVNSAIKYYSYALQYDPKNREVEKKLTDLVGARVVGEQQKYNSAADPKKAVVAGMIGWGMAFLLIMLISVFPGTPVPWLKMYIPQVAKWSWNLVGLIAGSSAVAGMTLSISGFLNHPDEELVFESAGSDWISIPSGAILLIGSGFFFLGAALFYVLAGLLQGNLTRSMIMIFGCVAGVALLSALMYLPEARYSVVMYGGNIAFFGCLIGWYAGAMMRPLSE